MVMDRTRIGHEPELQDNANSIVLIGLRVYMLGRAVPYYTIIDPSHIDRAMRAGARRDDFLISLVTAGNSIMSRFRALTSHLEFLLHFYSCS